ncbi:MAG: GNAT family N-acetyltransferase [Saprospiraceae bacterium]|nr:GNAT family N-acetyltransferase [Saprospiraceae bacterium]
MKDLETPRLNFREWRESDFEAVAQFFSDPIAVQYLGGQKSSEETWRLIAAYIGHYQLRGYSYMAIEEKHTHHLIGSIGLWNSTPWPELELGYWLFTAFRGKGYAHEAAKAAQDFAFTQLQRKTLVSYIDDENIASARLAKSLGGAPEEEIQLLDFGPHQVYRYFNTTK